MVNSTQAHCPTRPQLKAGGFLLLPPPGSFESHAAAELKNQEMLLTAGRGDEAHADGAAVAGHLGGHCVHLWEGRQECKCVAPGGTQELHGSLEAASRSCQQGNQLVAGGPGPGLWPSRPARFLKPRLQASSFFLSFRATNRQARVGHAGKTAHAQASPGKAPS